MKSNTHILILPSWYPSESSNIRGSFFREQALALSSSGYKVGVITTDLRSLKYWKTIVSDTHGIEYKNDMGINTLRFKTMFWFPRMPRLISQLSLAGGIAAFEQYLVKFGKPDIIHVHSCLYMGMLAVYIKDKYKINFVLTEHSSGFFRGIYDKFQLETARKVMRESAENIAVSKEMAYFLKDNVYDEKSWNVIPNIVNKKFFNTIRTIDNDKFRYINVAFMNKNKNQINIVKAFNDLLLKHVKNIELVLVGDGEERQKIEDYISHNKIKNISLVGVKSRDEVASLMVNSDCFILSSNYETFGVVAIEALASGIPVISTKCGGPEGIVNDDNGILIDRDDIDQLTNAMLSLKESRRERYNSQKIRDNCYKKYSEEAIINELNSIYKKYIQ